MVQSACQREHFSPVTFRHSILLGLIGTAVCWIAWAIVLLTIDPFQAGAIGIAAFFLTLFLAFLGTMTLLVLLIRRVFSRRGVAYQELGVSVREAFLLSLVFVGGLGLLAAGLFVWWSVALLLVCLTMLEFFFLMNEAK